MHDFKNYLSSHIPKLYEAPNQSVAKQKYYHVNMQAFH